MNILILSWRGPGHPNAGGAEISTHEHAKSWTQAGHNITLFTSYYRGGKEEETVDGVSVKRYGRQLFGVQWEAFKWYCFGSHPKFDLVIDQFHGIPFFTPIYIKTKKLAFIHEVTKEVWKLNYLPMPFNLFVASMGMLLEPLIFKLYLNVSFMTVSDSTKRDLTDWGIPENHISVIRNGISTLKPSGFLSKEKKKTLIYLGALAKDKGIESVLQVFSLLSKISDKWQFWVVGKSDPQYLSKLKKQSEALKVADKIKFWGYVSEEKKYELLSRAHLLLSPSIREGWGLVVIEAARSGTPTVAYNVPGLKDSVQDKKTGLLCECSPQSMAARVEELLRDETRYKTMCKNAINWSKNFSWEKSGKMSLELINKITS